MPKPPERPPSELDEVERAISLLGGRHPEHERTRRETLAAAEQRRLTLDQELRANARRRRRRVVVMAVNVVALGIAGAVAWKLVVRASRIRDALAAEEAPFLTHGLEEVTNNEVTARRMLEADAAAASCFVAIATAGKVVVHGAGSTLSGGRSIGWCGCAAGHVSIEAADAGDAPVGLALLKVDARTVGGPLARAWLTWHPEAWGEGGAECAEATLDTWIADHRWPKPVVTGAELDSLPGGEQLRASGFHFSTSIVPETPFAVVEAASGECALTVALGAELSLRIAGGARPIAHARDAMVWCEASPESVSVWATGGGGRVLIVSAPGARLGGLLGAREAASEAGHPVSPEASWLRAEDQSWDAKVILTASTVAEVTAGPVLTQPGAADARIAAIVSSANAGVTWQPSLADVACDPPMEATATTSEAVCVPAVASMLWRRADPVASTARGTMPLWMSALAQRHERDAVALLPQLLTLARRLTREGFEPTTFEGVTELEHGVRVVGRGGEDAVVAVGLAPSAPWVLPYSDGASWDLGDVPRVVALKPGAAVMLSSPATRAL